MDGKQGDMDGSKPAGPRDSPDIRLLSNPLMSDAVSDWSPMHEAAIYGHQLSLRNLISQVNGVTTDWHTPLFNACVSGSRDCVNLLLQHGASVQPESDLASPIHEAARRGHTECVDSLIAYGSNIDHKISHLGTPLYLACENQQRACVKKLLESGADVNQGKGQDSPLHAVARTASEELACLLMDFGADTQAKNAEGKRPVELVPPDSPLARLFLEREGPPSLMQLCRLRIRKCFGIQQHHKITKLVLPEDLKQFLLHL
ncbi:ankyrin repeat and SOCS box protein 9 isoform X3 [Macaca fascicularis]|uniref:Ankyrin repeat and SOCS box containing 9 n=1 Tax=Macaca nemestrina TaxID=9545 RepID=A0A2K6BHQ8_MACNE